MKRMMIFFRVDSQGWDALSRLWLIFIKYIGIFRRLDSLDRIYSKKHKPIKGKSQFFELQNSLYRAFCAVKAVKVSRQGHERVSRDFKLSRLCQGVSRLIQSLIMVFLLSRLSRGAR